MIAKNLLKFAEAMALQLPLPFGRLRMLRQSRPTTTAGRAARSARAMVRRALLAVKVIYPVKKPAAKRIKCTLMAWPQLSLFNIKNALLATKSGHVWVQAELKI